MPLAVTALYAGLNALILITLALATIGRRRRKRISVLAGDDAQMANLMRAHGNAAEFIPIFLILLAVSESLGAPGYVLHALAIPFTLGRILHGWHFVTAREDFGFRVVGMHLTLWTILAAAIGAIGHGLAAHF